MQRTVFSNPSRRSGQAKREPEPIRRAVSLGRGVRHFPSSRPPRSMGPRLAPSLKLRRPTVIPRRSLGEDGSRERPSSRPLGQWPTWQTKRRKTDSFTIGQAFSFMTGSSCLDTEWLLSTLFDASLLSTSKAAGNGGSFFGRLRHLAGNHKKPCGWTSPAGAQ